MSKLYVIADTRVIPKLNRNTYLSYHVHISHVGANNAQCPPSVIFAAKNRQIIDDLLRKSNYHGIVGEISPDDLAFYSSKTSTSVALIDNCYCDLEFKKEMCDIIIL